MNNGEKKLRWKHDIVRNPGRKEAHCVCVNWKAALSLSLSLNTWLKRDVATVGATRVCVCFLMYEIAFIALRSVHMFTMPRFLHFAKIERALMKPLQKPIFQTTENIIIHDYVCMWMCGLFSRLCIGRH